MKNKKYTLLHLVILLFTLCCLTTGVYSYMFMKTNTISNQFIPGVVSCDVSEKVNDNTKSEITVRNTGNIDAYIRVRLVTYWVNEHGGVVSKPSAPLTITPTNGWIESTDNTFYYPLSVNPGNETLNLLGDSIPLLMEDGYYQVIDVFAEAIQAKPARAVTDSWGVSVDGDGTITSVPH